MLDSQIKQLLKSIHEYAFVLKDLGLIQFAADLHFLCDYINSDEWDNPLMLEDYISSVYLAPHPAGKDTIDAYSNNCPIPYDSPFEINLSDYFNLVSNLKDDLITLKSLLSYDVAVTAVKSFIDIINGDSDNEDHDPIVPDEPITDTLILHLYLRAEDGTTPMTTHFGSNDHWFSIVKDQQDANKLSSLGHEVVYSRDIGFGCLKYSPDEFNYEIIDIYDEDGNHVNDYANTPDNLYISQNADSVLTICNKDIPINTYCYTWGLKITKKDLLVLWTTIKGNVNATVSDQTVWALFESDGSGNPHDWGNNEYDIVDYAYYPNGSNTLSWQGSSVANNYWQLVKGSNGDVRVKGNDGVRNSIAAIRLHVRSLPDEPIEPVPQDVYTITVATKSNTVIRFIMYKNDEPLEYQEAYDSMTSFDVTVNDTVYHVVRSYNDNYHYFQRAVSVGKLEIRGPGGKNLAPFVVNETYTLSNIIFN